jgi:hypothetical protein
MMTFPKSHDAAEGMVVVGVAGVAGPSRYGVLSIP